MRIQPSTAVAFALVAAISCSSKSASPTAPDAASGATAVTVSFKSTTPSAIRTGDTLTLQAVAQLAGGGTSDCTEASTWSSSNEKVLLPDFQRPGRVTVTGGGDATLTAKCGNVSGSVALSAVGLRSAAIKLADGHTSTFMIGERQPLAMNLVFDDGTSATCADATWSASAPNVADVNSSGSLEAKGSGTAVIEARCRGVFASLPITVRPGLRITGLENWPILLEHAAVTLGADIIDANGAVVRNCPDVNWAKPNDGVARLSGSRGAVVLEPGGLDGVTTITATCGDNAAQQQVTVGHIEVSGTVRSAAGGPANVIMMPRGISRWGDDVVTDSSGRYNANIRYPSVSFFLMGPGFENLTTPEVPWNRSTKMSLDYTMTPIQEMFLSGSNSICSFVMPPKCPVIARQPEYSFRAPRDGVMRITGYWVGFNASSFENYGTATLYCGATRVAFRSLGNGLGVSATVPVNTSCDYRIVFEIVTEVYPATFRFGLNMQ